MHVVTQYKGFQQHCLIKFVNSFPVCVKHPEMIQPLLRYLPHKYDFMRHKVEIGHSAEAVVAGVV